MIPPIPDPSPIVEAARRVSVDGCTIREWSIHSHETRRLSVGTKDAETGNAHAPLAFTESAAASYLLVWSDGRVSRGTLERRQIEADPVDALCRARGAAIDDPDGATVAGPTVVPDVELVDPSAAAIAAGNDSGWLAERLESLTSSAAAHAAATWSGSIGAGAGSVRLVTSAGLDLSGSGTSLSWSQSLDGLVSDGWSSRGPDAPAAFADRLRGLGERLSWMRRPADPPPPGEVPVLLHPDVVEAYVLSTLFHNLGGSIVDHGEGAFRAGQFGTADAVFREDLALRIDPLAPLRSGSYRFTAEGVAAEACTFIADGRLIRPVLDRKYARRLGLRPTAVPYAYDTVHLEGPGILDEADAVASSACTVLSVLGVHTQDRASGDFSLSAPQIVAHRDGRRTGRLRGTIAGNLFSLLRAEDTRRVRCAGEHTPGLLVRCRLDADRP